MTLSRTTTVALSLLCLLGAGGPVALSESGAPSSLDPCHEVNQPLEPAAPPGGPVCDHPQLPVPKSDSSLWTQVAGARFGNDDVIQGSATRVIDDLYAVGFRNSTFGFAAGAACVDPDDDVTTCTRHPVMYRYSDPDDRGARWERDPTFAGEGRGFVGAIAYIPHSDGEFLAVGGDGCYPRREGVPCADGFVANTDPIAGKARAWHFAGGRWREITSELNSAMLGMAALAFTPAAASYGFKQHGVAGALGQLWLWHNGSFEKDPLDARSSKLVIGQNSGATVSRADFRYRVRDVRAPTSPNNKALIGGRFLAVTAGCGPSATAMCVVDPNINQASVTSAPVQYGHASVLSDNGDSWTISDPYAARNARGTTGNDPRQASLFATGWEFTYSADQTPTAGASSANGLWNPDGPPSPLEPPSSTSNWYVGGTRLVSADGQVASAGSYDWYVGVFRPSGHGVAVGSGAVPVQPEGGVCAGSAVSATTGCNRGDPVKGDLPSVDAEQERRHQASYRVLDLGTYPLNAIRMSNGQQGGQGFAVGDRGAIVQLGEAVPPGGVEPAPPQLSPGRAAPFTDTAPYGAFRPLVTGLSSGGVPALDTRPLEALSRPGPVAAGSADPASGPFADIGEVVMSRDGSEGWAVGGQSGLTLYHYQGGRWSRCEPIGAPPLIPADPRCADLADMAVHGLHLYAAARVPHENGGQASRTDEFEIVAVGTYNPTGQALGGQPAIVRYSDGRWHPEDAAHAPPKRTGDTRLHSVAFGAPNDGWALGTWMTSGAAPVYHYDGQRWIDCSPTPTPARCDDGNQRFPHVDTRDGNAAAVLRFTTVGSRVYLSGSRVFVPGGASSTTTSRTFYPLILCHDKDHGGQWRVDGCGYDPALDEVPQGSSAALAGSPSLQGQITSLALNRSGDRGWAAGWFGGTPANGATVVADAHLLRLEAGTGWSKWRKDDATSDYLTGNSNGRGNGEAVVLASVEGSPFGSAVMASATGPLLGFDDAADRWRVVEGPANPLAFEDAVNGRIEALTPDGHNGFWMAAGDPQGRKPLWFYDYTDRARRPLFTDAPHPLDRPITALAGAPDGSVWLATDSDLLARYDRVTGWDVQHIPGWDPGRVVTAASPATALALGVDGTGLVVGVGGRIADLTGASVELNPAAGAATCGFPPAAPVCGTGRTLRAAAVAPDDSALVGGDSLTLLWRARGGEFQTIATPAAAAAARITGIAMPSGDRAWVSLSTGQVFLGTLADGDWSWSLENTDKSGDPLWNDMGGNALALRAIAIDATGHGLAVGDRGLVLERDPSGGLHPWRRVETGFGNDLTSVALPAGSGEGALIGGAHGLMLTRADGRFEVAHAADGFGPKGKTVVGAAMLPGVRDGQTEAWVALSDLSSGSALLHYTSDPGETLLNPDDRAQPLPDVPPRAPGEIGLAALGKSDCLSSGDLPCSPLSGLALSNDIVARRVADAVVRASKEPAGPRFALFSGDVNDAAGRLLTAQATSSGKVAGVETPLGARMFTPNVANWAGMIADRMRGEGVPVFAAPGVQDVSSDVVCVPNACVSQKELAGRGTCAASQCVAPVGNAESNLLWRQALAEQPRPWGNGDPFSTDDLSFDPVKDRGVSVHSPIAGARTHYALDVVDREGRRRVRVVVVDNSQRSLAASDAVQHPVESGGQQAWLQQMLCRGGPGCSRGATEPAIVVANTPTYSYGPGTGSGTAADAASFEATLLANQASLVVSGRLGWNGLYYALAAGLHYPCPGGSYPPAPPAGVPGCGTAGSPDAKAPSPPPAQGGPVAAQLGATLGGLGAPSPPQDVTGTVTQTATGALPFVVASGAGGKLAETGGEGDWHGYTLVRLDASGDPGKTIVTQRPIFDWVAISAPERTLYPGQRIQLKGIGREPLSVDKPAQLDAINSPAITHRYDLLEADPAKPWLPKVVEGNGQPHGYVPLDPSVATVDPQTGKVLAQRSAHGRVYAIALLSVGEKAATFPLVFEPKRSYTGSALRVPVPPVVPQVRVLAFNSASLQTPSAPPPAAPPPPGGVNLQPPAPPQIPTFLPATASPVTPPVPPAPPAPAGGSPTPPLKLSIGVVGVAVPPATGVTAQPTPPVNPSPPAGARREAKQHQASAAKSEEGASQDATDAAGDLAQGPLPPHGSSAMTRHDRVRADGGSFSMVQHEQASAWVTGLQLGGGLTIMALVLAFGWMTVRPTPRGRGRARSDIRAAPAWTPTRRRW